MKSKKIKLSVLTQIALLFLAALLLSTVAGLLVNRSYILENATQQGGEMARLVAVAAVTAIGSEDNVDDLMGDKSFREQVHKRFRFICNESDVKYLYLYTVDGDGVKHYIVSAAADDEEDRKINETYGFGSEGEQPLYDAEIEVMNGNLDGEYEYISDGKEKLCMFVLPVVRNNEIRALIGVDYSIDSILEIEYKDLRAIIMQVVITMGIAYVIALFMIRRLVIKHILSLSERMKHFVENRDKNVTTQASVSRVDNEITDMEASFDKMANDISGYLDDIRSLAGEKAQIDAQFHIARRIQQGLTPQESSYYCEGCMTYAVEDPAIDVGGDFYDVFRIDDDHVCIIVGDISGKGISAALFMAMVRVVLIERIKAGGSLDDTMNKVNDDICMRNTENMFATVFALILDTRTGLLKYANAGHESPLLLTKDPSFLEVEHGMALGLFTNPNIVTQEVQLHDGEGILIYTDGVIDAINKDNVRYGGENLIKTVVSEYAALGECYRADGIVRSVVGSIKEYSRGVDQFDDITCTALVYKENERRKLSSDIGSFKAVKQTMITSLGDNDDTRRMILACEEIFANIISYSGADDVDFSCSYMGRIYSVTFSDNGAAFDPVSADVREKDFEELDTGGMGIKLAKMNSNDMIYARTNGRNVLTMKFNIKNKS